MSNQPKNQPKIILASQSPRRRELLSRMGITHFDVLPAQGEEHIDHSLPAGLLVEALARQKAAEIAACAPPDAVIIAADTVVALDNEILGKPHTAQEAAEMLQKLSGRQHTVYTGVAVRQNDTELVEREAAQVHFRPLSPQEIRAYIATGEPMDKAGAYGVQGYGCLFVEGIVGDYYNVMGLPVCRLGRMLRQFGVDPLALAAEQEAQA
ncbi:MAG: septum formation inhibitor Maf [Oscillospiraceae bacterium]|nr:septum formation inhibitor Maf [Oscillospiraceae bacterium]MCI9394388.1 septum formation inhibitor Maf [Oscillospiraceae bacterium]